ncbi:hypothetical protein BJ322DRAFT_1043900 [Thelephora terrestris]|uniref:Uncharacterized protein n=1 Tax=Thelephora terrestris TaxID=56493 RepID=A0A9P6HMS9_9AGAM|nr:hypothetical protein BJ322DRAFT_1043900 [Thelephora terrestris]
MSFVSLPLSLLLASFIFPVYSDALGQTDGSPDGHLGTTWEVVVAVSLGLLLFIAATTITILIIRQRRRQLKQLKQPDFTYASRPTPPAFAPSMPYGLSRPSSVYQPRDKHGRHGSPDRASRLRETV